MGLSRGVKGCIGKYLAVELLMKCVWQFGGDTCLILPILFVSQCIEKQGAIGLIAHLANRLMLPYSRSSATVTHGWYSAAMGWTRHSKRSSRASLFLT